MHEKQFNQLPSQGTIYSTGKLGNHLIIGAGDSGKVFAQISNTLVQQIPLQNLPYDCDILSVDAYIDAFPVLAVGFVHKCNGSTPGALQDARGREGYITSHLNIYSTWISVDQDSPTANQTEEFKFKTCYPKEEFHASHFELISQNCTSFVLDYIPYHLYHIPVLKRNEKYGNIVLLSGSDGKIHAYEADEDNSVFIETDITSYFPELGQKFPSVVTQLLIHPVNELTSRVTLCGLESGQLLIWVVTSKVHKRRRQDSEVTLASGSGSVTPLKSVDPLLMLNDVESNSPLFNEEGAEEEEEDLLEPIALESAEESFQIMEHNFEGMITAIKAYNDGFSLNIIVTSALSPAYVYTNVIDEEFKAGKALKFSSSWDAIECCCVDDIDKDGENEIIIGTFGCTVLVYKYMDEILPQWVIVSKMKFPRPILSIDFSYPDLLVVSGLGLHIVKYDTAAYFTNKPENIDRAE